MVISHEVKEDSGIPKRTSNGEDQTQSGAPGLGQNLRIPSLPYMLFAFGKVNSALFYFSHAELTLDYFGKIRLIGRMHLFADTVRGPG